MIHRMYTVLMPAGNECLSSALPLDIVVQSYPGTKAAPIKSGNAPVGWSGADGAYYEWRGRPLRLPVLASAGASGGFVPRFNLGFFVRLTPIKAGVITDQPSVQLSQTLAALASTDSGPTINITTLADPSYGPVIRLIGGGGTCGAFWNVHVQVMDVRDEDRDPLGL